jgi:hypothetical protein
MRSLKIKRFIYYFLGILVQVPIYYYSIKFTHINSWSFIPNILMGILGVICALVIPALLQMAFLSSNIDIFTFNYLNILFKYKSKYVYHDKLGYFIMEFNGEKISVYRQSILYKKELFCLEINDLDSNSINFTELVADKIKAKLDEVYKKKVEEIKVIEKIKNKSDLIDKWDGYLDTQSRRDDKIDNILGK